MYKTDSRLKWILQTAAPRGVTEKPSIVLQLDYTSHRSWLSLGSSQLQLEGSLGQMGNGVLSSKNRYFTFGIAGGCLLERRSDQRYFYMVQYNITILTEHLCKSLKWPHKTVSCLSLVRSGLKLKLQMERNPSSPAFHAHFIPEWIKKYSNKANI